uniref:Reverse transcriptase domain-containing protein n=1 Tax=Fagus sylvatica TaxID=28930 RepID=A0A2N9G9A9_FAGSY
MEDICGQNELEELISPVITDAENSGLCQIPTLTEIKNVIFGMQSLKSPGPDGLPPLFYKKYWQVVGNSVIKAVRNFFISVSPAQSAFIPGRWIAENQLIVQEILHSFKQRKVKGGFVAMKLDLQKAYDRTNWEFLKEGADSVWLQSNFYWLDYGMYFIKYPFLYWLIEREFLKGSIRGVKMNVNGPAFTHVMYADDIMLFAKANSSEVQILDNCMVTYCEWSGQSINRNKSGLICSKLVSRDKKREIKSILAMKKVQANAHYLGSPLFHSSSRIKDFRFLQEKLEARLTSWRSKTLSWAGRATLIKSVAMAIPVYSFSSSNVPTTICDKMDASIRRFWWNPSKESGRYLAWKAWDDLCVPKAIGGMGFRCANQFNAALLAKLTWMIVTGRDSPCMHALRSKYKVKEGWISREPLKKSSPNWRAIERLKPLIQNGACFVIGDVANLINWEINAWRIGLLEEMFDQVSVSAILRISLPLVPRADKLTWVADLKGVFTVKSAMVLLQRITWPAVPNPIWLKFWKCKMHERLKTLIWCIGCGALPTNLNFFSGMAKGDPCCPLCNADVESIAHLFFKCQATKMFWFGTCWGIRADLFLVNEDIDVVKLVVNPPIPHSAQGMLKQNLEFASIQIALTLETIWRFRNQLVHQSKIENPMVSIKALEYRIVEHMQEMWSKTKLVSYKNMKWSPPPCGILKLNVDAAMLQDAAMISVIARNESGLFVKAWVKLVHAFDPLVAEAAAVLWAIQNAKVEKWSAICVESDSKMVVDLLLQENCDGNWNIEVICNDVRSLAVDFNFCSFCWVKREANMVAHTLAKLGPQLELPAVFFPKNLPPLVEEAWFRDFSCIPVAF